MGSHSHSQRLAVVSEDVDEGASPTRVLYDGSNFLLLGATVPYTDPDGYEGRLVPICERCLLEQHPQAGRGMDLAKRHRAAHVDEHGAWIGGE